MIIPSDKNQFVNKRLAPLSVLLLFVLAIARRLTGFFKLTEEERVMAGIVMGSIGRDQ